MITVADDRNDRIRTRKSLDLALLQGHTEQVRRVGSPLDILDRIDALFDGQDRYEILVRTGHADRSDGLALQRGNTDDTGLARGDQSDASAMDRRRQLYIETLLKRLHPGQGHADPGISLATRE